MNGDTKSRCFDVRLGWFQVLFLDEQVLHWTYSGSEGKIALPAIDVTLVYIWINTCPQSLVVILLKSTAPSITTPDGFSLEPHVASHPILGSGNSSITLLIEPLPPDQRLARVVFYHSITFPGDAIP